MYLDDQPGGAAIYPLFMDLLKFKTSGKHLQINHQERSGTSHDIWTTTTANKRISSVLLTDEKSKKQSALGTL